jgi:hypothetical protein
MTVDRAQNRTTGGFEEAPPHPRGVDQLQLVRAHAGGGQWAGTRRRVGDVLRRYCSISIRQAVSLPLWVAIAIAIRVSSRGPVLLHQERVTKGGRVFRMHKFRTMKPDADSPMDTSAPFFKLESLSGPARLRTSSARFGSRLLGGHRAAAIDLPPGAH